MVSRFCPCLCVKRACVWLVLNADDFHEQE
jgi:hypothetical protein